jgi:tetratricopeptide (TPR) repeat protein
LFSTEYSANKERILLWKRTLDLAEDNLFSGVGVGNWKIILSSYDLSGLPEEASSNKVLTNKFLKNTYFQRPHNDYLWVLSEIGIFGFLFYLSSFAIVIIYVFKIWTQQSNRDDKMLSILMFFGITGYMVIAFFTFPKERIFHSMFLLVMMAIVISIYHRTSGTMKNVSRSAMLLLMMPCLLLLALAVANGHARLRAEVFTKRALAARKAENWPMVISEIDKGYSAFATLDPMSTPLKWYRGEANYLINNIPQALEDFEQAYKAHPHHIHVLNNLGTCYEIGGDHDKAVFFYKKALDICPEFEEALINLGATYYNAGRFKEAYETLLRCNPDTTDSRLKEYLEITKREVDKKQTL